jgi:uncharacterized RDD family membrane protein YckC
MEPQSPEGSDRPAISLEPAEVRRAPDGTLIGRLAPVTMRVIAQILTASLWALVQTAVFLAVVITTGDDGYIAPAIVAVVWLAPYVVDVLLVAAYGWDPGKLALGLRVVGPRGDHPGLLAALLRTVVVHLPMLVVGLGGVIGDVMAWLYLPWLIAIVVSMARNPDNQGWQDRVAGTFVVTRDRRDRGV